jgi:ATP adenylyltransferase
VSAASGEPDLPRRGPVPDLDFATGPARLWTPWRMRYVGGGAREEGCIFCNRLAEDDDARTLILRRGTRAFVIMNLYPYNTGHVMIVPTAHIPSPEDADEETTIEMTALRAPVIRALRRALAPAGFNLGLNVGSVAGAGVSDHLHEHVVPRWEGDANFMPILASTMVMPELIPVTYAKIRAELERDSGLNPVAINVVLSDDGRLVLTNDRGELPRIQLENGEPVWRAALRDAQERGEPAAELVGWAGASRAGQGPIALLNRAGCVEGGSVACVALRPIGSLAAGFDVQLVRAAINRFASSG